MALQRLHNDLITRHTQEGTSLHSVVKWAGPYLELRDLALVAHAVRVLTRPVVGEGVVRVPAVGATHGTTATQRAPVYGL